MTRHIITLVAGLTVFLATLVPVIAAEPQPKAANDDAAQLKAAMEERIKVLTGAEQILEAQYRVGTVAFGQLVAVERDLRNAELESCDEPAKRIGLLEKHLKKAEDLQHTAEAKYKAGTVSEVDIRCANAEYLNVKIQLLRERAKSKRTPNHTSQ